MFIFIIIFDKIDKEVIYLSNYIHFFNKVPKKSCFYKFKYNSWFFLIIVEIRKEIIKKNK